MKLKDLVQQLGDISASVKYEDYEVRLENANGVHDFPAKGIEVIHERREVLITYEGD